jgi:hypothetical protein
MATRPKSRKFNSVEANSSAPEAAEPNNGFGDLAPPPAAPKPRSGAVRLKRTSGSETVPAPANSETIGAAPENDATPAENERVDSAPPRPGSVKGLRAKKKRAPDVPSNRDALHTVEDRMKQLDSIQSLKQPIPDEPAAPAHMEVDSSAAPPDQPLPPPEAEPTPSGHIDRGAPIPEHYSLDRLVVLMRDPFWLFVYWELKGGALERLRFQHSAEVIDSSRWVLRVKTLHTPQSSSPDRGVNQYIVDIDLRVGQWYLKVAPSTSFSLDMGFINQQGEFILVLTGNEIRTPPHGVSNVMDERWIILREELERLLKVGGTPHPVAPFLSATSNAAGRIGRSEKPRSLGLFSSHSMIRDVNG